MAIPETWQTPSTDDIDTDSLEYLFGDKKPRADIPWVNIASEPDTVAHLSPEMVRLQAKVEIMLTQLEIFTNKLAKANHDLGGLRAELAEKDKQLALQADYRARAALALVFEVQCNKLRERVKMLEELLPSEGTDETEKPERRQPSELDMEATAVTVSLAAHATEPTVCVSIAEPVAMGADANVPATNKFIYDYAESYSPQRSRRFYLMPLTYLSALAFAVLVLHMIL